MPQIEYLNQGNKKLYFIVSSAPTWEKNVTTIITGKNAVGKSRLLRSIVVHGIEDPNFKKVIVISGTEYHKFPDYNNRFEQEKTQGKYINLTSNNRRRLRPDDFTYVDEHEAYRDFCIQKFLKQMDIINTAPYLFVSSDPFLKCVNRFIVEFSKNIKVKVILGNIVKFLNFDPFIKIQFSLINRMSRGGDNTEFVNRLEEYISESNVDAKDIQALFDLKTAYINCHKYKVINLFDADEYMLQHVSLLIKHGLLRVNRISFSKNKELYSYRDLSSGELALLKLILGLSSSMTNNSVVCIDEPEVSLHPEWQEKVIQLVELVTGYFEGCHIFIATHSPQLISGVNDQSTFVLDLSQNKTSNISHYKNRSSDFQLSEVFNFPGNNNEYLIRKMLLIVNKTNSIEGYVLDGDELLIYRHVNAMIKNRQIHDDDKVKIIFDLIDDFRG